MFWDGRRVRMGCVCRIKEWHGDAYRIARRSTTLYLRRAFPLCNQIADSPALALARVYPGQRRLLRSTHVAHTHTTTLTKLSLRFMYLHTTHGSYLESARGRSAKMKGYFDDSDEEDNSASKSAAAGPRLLPSFSVFFCFVALSPAVHASRFERSRSRGSVLT